jgi:hypothetical protein
MVRIAAQAFWLFVPTLTDIGIRGKPAEGFESLGAVGSQQEGVEVLLQGLMGLVGVLFDRGLFAWPSHPLHRPLGPGMLGCGQALVAALLLTDASDDLMTRVDRALPGGEWDAVSSQHGVDRVGDGSAQVP